MRTIGAALDYRRLAELHKPNDAGALASECRRLHSEGLKPRDIASALGVHIDLVMRAITQRATS